MEYGLQSFSKALHKVCTPSPEEPVVVRLYVQLASLRWRSEDRMLGSRSSGTEEGIELN